MKKTTPKHITAKQIEDASEGNPNIDVIVLQAIDDEKGGTRQMWLEDGRVCHLEILDVVKENASGHRIVRPRRKIYRGNRIK